MPVTVGIPPLPGMEATEVNTAVAHGERSVMRPEDVLRDAGGNSKDYNECGKSYQAPGSELVFRSEAALYHNGFVGTAIHAYMNHHHLIIRPDDVWAAIVSQLGLYIKGNPNVFSHIMTEDHPLNLAIEHKSNRLNVDMISVAEKMNRKIKASLVDPAFMDRLRPNFTTTTDSDTTVCSVLAMASLGRCFNHEIRLESAIPVVTLLGETEDWTKLEQKAEEILNFDDMTKLWYKQLRPILRWLTVSFTKSSHVGGFWSNFIRHDPEGAGSSNDYLWGWITTFCSFDSNGNYVFDDDTPKRTIDGMYGPGPDFSLVAYYRLHMNKIPVAYGLLPVKMLHNEKWNHCKVLAGSVGTRVVESRDYTTELPDKNKGVMPISFWWLYEVPGPGND